MSKKTPLFDKHRDAGAKLIDFGGWQMPLHYGSQIDEHHAVRRGAGVFDVSHMTVVDLTGADATAYLRRLLANDVDKLKAPGRGLYSCMLNETGGVIDDLIAYRIADQRYRVVVNAATRDKDLAWMSAQAGDYSVNLSEQPDSVMLALQGPTAIQQALPLLPSTLQDAVGSLRQFHCADSSGWFVARTGYTGESGLEVVIDQPEAALDFWDALLSNGFAPAGLGARDTLRLEAGLCLYGQDLDEEHSPLVSGLAWTVAFDPADREFNGRASLQSERDAGPAQQLVGLVLAERGVMRHGQRVLTPAGEGLVTSGSFSPTLGQSIALARLPAGADGDCRVEIRNAERRARIVPPLFVRNGEIQVDLADG
jgi:aminomethyltransferase